MRSTGLVLVMAIACGNDHAAPPIPDAPPNKMIDASTIDAPNPLEPPTLAGTGLCVDEACTMIASDVMEYAPGSNYVLWADFAQKGRWIYLPPGTQIDTSDPNHWVFPMGTKIWKEFDLPAAGSDGPPLVRVETRYIVKVGSDETGTGSASPWFYVAYQWDSMAGGDLMGSSTMAVPNGVIDANGTNHDIPSRTQCKSCHEDMLPGRVLGLSALALDFHQTGSGLLDLDDFIQMGLLTVPPAGSASPHYPFPVDASGTDILALQYAHMNCGECHNPTSPVDLQVPVLFRIDATTLGSGGVAQTSLFQTTIGQTGGPILDGSDAHGNCAPITDPSGSAGAAPLYGCTDIVVGPWQADHMYNFDDRVVAAGNTYLCSTKGAQVGTNFPCGTSGATPPGGTGSGIVDGTATWEYIGAPSTRSILIYRYETTNVGKHMPPAGENITDPTGDAIFNAWLNALP